MISFVLIFAPVFTGLFGVLFAAILALRPPGLPLSVRVPRARSNDAVVRSAIVRFRWGLVIAWVATSGLTVMLILMEQATLAVVVPVLAYALLSILDLILSRRMILRAKREEGWFEGLPVRVSAQITGPMHQHPPIVWPALAVIVLAFATAVNVELYPTLPRQIAVHFAITGQPDRWATKSVWSVFGLLIVGAAIAGLLSVLSVFAARFAARTQSDDTAEQAALRTKVQRGMLTSLLSQLAFVIALGISAIEIAQRLLPEARWATAAGAVVMVVLVMLVILTNVMRGRQRLRPANRRDPHSPRPDAVDDDQHWKGGLFYVNRDDPALLVPRRFGLGWTINFGRPGGIAVTIVLLLAIAAVVTALVLATHAR